MFAFTNTKSWLNVLGLSLLAMSGLISAGCRQGRVADVPLYDEVKPVKLEIAETEGTVESRRVLIVCNIASRDSIELTEYYARKRKIPPSNVVQIDVPITEEITQGDFDDNLIRPVRNALAKLGKRIDYIVLTRGVPFRVDNEWGYSVDSLLVGLKREKPKLAPPNFPPSPDKLAAHINPYFDVEEPFNSENFGIYLVTRLDGYTLDDAKRLVERGIKAQPFRGPFLFDYAPNRFDDPDGKESSGWHSERMAAANQALVDRDFMTIIEDPEQVKKRNEDLTYNDNFLGPTNRLMGYVSWGSNDASFDLDTYRKLRFLPGSIAETYVSTSARTFIPTDEGQSLIGDLIRNGVTGVKGYVSEPWTIALARVDIMMDRYTRGFNLAETMYASSQLIRWKDVVIGDPLMRPYGKFVDGKRPEILPTVPAPNN